MSKENANNRHTDSVHGWMKHPAIYGNKHKYSMIMKEIDINKYIQNELIRRELKALPFKVRIYVDPEAFSPYSTYNESNSTIVFSGINKISDLMLMHEILHLKSKTIGYARLRLDDTLHEAHKRCFARIRSTYEHVVYVYPMMREMGFIPYNEQETESVVKCILAKADEEIIYDLWQIVLLCCSLYETENVVTKNKIVKRINGFNHDGRELCTSIISMIEKGNRTASVKEKNEILKDLIDKLARVSMVEGKAIVEL